MKFGIDVGRLSLKLFLDIEEGPLKEQLAALVARTHGMPSLAKSSSEKAAIALTHDQKRQVLKLAGPDGVSDEKKLPLRAGTLIDRIRYFCVKLEMKNRILPKIGPYQFDVTHFCLIHTSSDAPLYLTEKEAALLSFLLKKRGKTIERDELLREVWGYQHELDTHTLETHIYRLRHKMEEKPSEPALLVTQGKGYCLVS